MDPLELARRRPVWQSLSDVFLDTETRWSLPGIAAVLVESGYGPDELERIWRWELVPEFIGNLLQVAGEWGGLALDEASLLRRASRPPGLLREAVDKMRAMIVECDWRVILQLRTLLLAAPAERRADLVTAWSMLARAYFTPEDEPPEKHEMTQLLSTGFSRSECRRLFDEELRPLYRTLLIDGERASEETRAHHVTALIAEATPNA